ncbi:MAG: hypothetical protein Q4B06_01810 [Candidatus Saccharibacteria bacterium]|nr:hypothetical protein [Candidatus Saccharibacteria bacterium]
MKRVWHYLVIVGLMCVTMSHAAAALAVVPSVPLRKSSPLAVTEFSATQDMPAYVQLYNASETVVKLSDWRFEVRAAGAVVQSYELPQQYLAPGSYVVMSATPDLQGEGVLPLEWLESFTQDDIVVLAHAAGEYTELTIPMNTLPQQVRYAIARTASGGVAASHQYKKLADQTSPVIADGVYVPRATFPLAPIEILPKAKDCSPANYAADCTDYVKFYNHTDSPVDFAGVRLRIGHMGQSITKQNTVPLTGVVQPGEYVTIQTLADGSSLNVVDGGAYVWLEDSYGIVPYLSTIVEYPSVKQGTSWARDVDGVWRWGVPQPTGPNQIIPPQPEPAESVATPAPCPAGQERNPATGRCRKVQAPSVHMQPDCPAGQERNPATGRCRKIAGAPATTAVKPCGPGEYRHPETGRCRKLQTVAATKAAALTPCKPGEERNPATGRCRKIPVPKTPKPCPAGQERNPQTGRCRKVQSQAKDDKQTFAVEEVAPSGDTIASWVALAGAGSIAVGYAGWEWRREVWQHIVRIKDKLSGGK